MISSIPTTWDSVNRPAWSNVELPSELMEKVVKVFILIILEKAGESFNLDNLILIVLENVN